MKGKLTPLVGKKIGKLQVLQKVNKASRARPYYRCQCDCGKRLTVHHDRLIHKRIPKLHCGCENQGPSTKHKIEYHAWWDMINRCHNENHPSYPRYGAKGVTVCDEWREQTEHKGFYTFLDYLGKRPEGMSLDRIDPEGNYEPGNVRWADNVTQARNKRGTKWVKDPKTGKPIRAAELAEREGVSYQKLRAKMIEEGTWEN